MSIYAVKDDKSKVPLIGKTDIYNRSSIDGTVNNRFLGKYLNNTPQIYEGFLYTSELYYGNGVAHVGELVPNDVRESTYESMTAGKYTLTVHLAHSDKTDTYVRSQLAFKQANLEAFTDMQETIFFDGIKYAITYGIRKINGIWKASMYIVTTDTVPSIYVQGLLDPYQIVGQTS